MKYHSGLEDIIQVNPYLPSRRTLAPHGRLHFANSFNSFVGREDEQKRLNIFADNTEQILWWIVIGEGGIGKSRLLLEWMRGLPITWFGFFMKSEVQTGLCAKLTPFTDTVIVVDYVLGNEEFLAQIIPALISAFERTRFKLRIILLERHIQVNARNGWYTSLKRAMSSGDFIRFMDAVYKENPYQRETIVPLELAPLKSADEEKYVESYLHAYLESTSVDSAMFDFATEKDKIVAGFHQHLDEKFFRPLFLSIYIEMWIYKNGNLAPADVEDLLEMFLQREEERWLEILGGDEEALDAYLQILAFASAIDIACLNSGDNGYLQNASEYLYNKLHQGVRHGRSKLFWDDLFIWEEKRSGEHNGESMIRQIINSDNIDKATKSGAVMSFSKIIIDPNDQDSEPDIYMLISPEYPDIIREFIVYYYISDDDAVKFSKTARNQSTLEFGLFLNRAIEDFPKEKLFALMAITPPEYDSDLFEFYTTLLCSIKELIPYRTEIEQVLLNSPAKEAFIVAYEMELWHRIAIVLEEDCKDSSMIFENAQAFLDYAKERINNVSVFERLPDMIETYVVGFYNIGSIMQLETFLNDVTPALVIDDYIAMQCAEGYYRLAELRELLGEPRHIRKDVNSIISLVGLYPGDVDITLYFANTAKKYIRSIQKQHMSGRITRINNQLVDEFKRLVKTDADNEEIVPEIAGSIAICLVNEYFEYHDTENQRPNANERMNFCEKEIYKLYQQYENEPDVVRSYATLTADKLMDGYMTPEITEEQCAQFKGWFEKYPGEIEFAESYCKVLFLRYSYLKENGLYRKAGYCIKEMERVAKLADYEEYNETNQLQEIVNMIKYGIV